MRSRYTAYAIGLASYIVSTTHPKNPLYQTNREVWVGEIKRFSEVVSFEKLDILSSSHSMVTFHATLRMEDQDLSFTEKSTFKKEENLWLYLKGDILDS